MYFIWGEVKKDEYVITDVEMERENKTKQNKMLMKPPHHLNPVL